MTGRQNNKAKKYSQSVNLFV